jgi:beta-glucanase (GH16 family)
MKGGSVTSLMVFLAMMPLITSSILLMLIGTVAAEPPGTLLPGGAGAWKLAWSEEFDGPDARLDERWVSQNGPSGHILCSRWRENAVVADGMLRLINRKEKRGGQNWTSGSITTREKFQYGYFECRYRYAAAKGTNNSFWLMTGREPAPGKGKAFEIDINEGHFPNEVNTNIHNWTDIKVVNGKKTHPSSSKSFTMGKNDDLARDFHTYGLKWNEKELVFYFDGREIRREKNVFCHSPSPVWLSLAIISWAGKVTDAVDGTFMEVDYVRIYQPK